MASKSQQYNASVNFGATVDPSMGRTLNRLTSGIEHIGAETSALTKTQTAWQRQVKAGSASTVTQMKHMERATQALINKHETLEKEIRDSVKNGRAGTAFLIEDYKKVGAGIESARREMEKLTKEQERESKLAQKQQRRDARRERIKGAGWNVLGAGVDMAGSALKHAPAAIAGAGATGIVGLIGGALALNHKTADEYRLSQQYGMSYRRFKTGSILAEQAGLNGENFGDLSEELSNKLGEMGNDKTLNPMLAQIGLNKHMTGTKQHQFDEVMQKISQGVLSGKLTAQQGESLADQLMGGEANKLMTYIIGMKKTYKEAMDSAGELNNVTEDEARAALESSQVLSNLWTSAETAMQGIAGELGNALMPQIKEWESQSIKWIKDNKEAISKSIGTWVDGGGPQRLVNGLETFGRALSYTASAINALLPDNSDAGKQKRVLQELGQTGSEELAAQTAHKEGLDAWFNAHVKGNKPLLNQARDAYTATRGWIFDDNDKFEAMLGYAVNALDGKKAGDQPESPDGSVIPFNARAGGTDVRHTHNNQFQFNVVINGGTPEAMAQDLYQQFTSLVGGSGVAGGSSDTFDSASLMHP